MRSNTILPIIELDTFKDSNLSAVNFISPPILLILSRLYRKVVKRLFLCKTGLSVVFCPLCVVFCVV